MKLRLSLSLRHALLVCLGLVALPTQADVVLNDYSNGGVISVSNTNLILNGDWNAPSSIVSWDSSSSETLSLSGSGTLQVKEISASGNDQQRNFSIGESITLLNGQVSAVQGAQVTYKGSVAASSTGSVEFWAYDGGSIDLNNATISADTTVELSLQMGGSIALSNYKVTNNHSLTFQAVDAMPNWANNVFDGNLELADGGLFTMRAGDVGEWLPATITGKIDVSGATQIMFKSYMSEYDMPTDGTILLTCSSISGDTSLLTLAQTYSSYDATGKVDYTQEIEGYTIKSMAYGDGYALYLAAVSDTPAIPEPATATLSLLAFAGLAARRRRK